MDERLEALLENLKATAGQVSDAAAGTASAVTSGAAAVVSHAQTKLKLVDLKAEVNLQLRELGELLYATHTGNPTDSAGEDAADRRTESTDCRAGNCLCPRKGSSCLYVPRLRCHARVR